MKNKNIYYTNGINEKKCYKKEEVPEGWLPGRLNPTKRRFSWYTDGTTNLQISAGGTIPVGFKKGRTVKWEVHQWTGTERRAQSLKKKGVKMSEVARAGMSRAALNRPPMSPETKKKISEHSNNNRAKANSTIISRYGSLENYYKLISEKTVNTKKCKGNLNTSEAEKLFHKMLLEDFNYPDVLTQYKSKVYPYRCDFYIRSLDLYIECNFHWTHGGHPFDSRSKEDQAKLEKWQEKAKTSKFYQKAIEVWTIKDPEKLACAKTNNLNYITIYDYRSYYNILYKK